MRWDGMGWKTEEFFGKAAHDDSSFSPAPSPSPADAPVPRWSVILLLMQNAFVLPTKLRLGHKKGQYGWSREVGLPSQPDSSHLAPLSLAMCTCT